MATAPAAPCAQDEHLFSPSTNEDCLWVNVYAPQPLTAGQRRPVFVFEHGGGGTNGDPNQYDGTNMARSANIIVVSIAYRLGIFGSLALPGLDGQSPQRVSGNEDALDEQAALQWVQRNIAQFGGDPHNVAFGGQSRGASALQTALVMPSDAGLFQRGIGESGAGFGPTASLASGEQQWLSAINTADQPPPAGNNLGCPTQVAPEALVACLRAVPADKLAATFSRFAARGPNYVVDGVVIPKPGPQQFASGDINRAPVIFGSTHDEQTFFQASSIPTQAAYDAALTTSFGSQLAGQVAQLYPASSFHGSFTQAYAAATGDEGICVGERARQVMSRYMPVYGYEFDQPNPVLWDPRWVAGPASLPDLTLGDPHTSELSYVFGHTGSGQPLNGTDLLLSHKIMDYWTNFVRAGNPNAPGGPRRGVEPQWPAYPTGAPGSLQSLSSPVTVESSSAFYAAHQCGFWISAVAPE